MSTNSNTNSSPTGGSASSSTNPSSTPSAQTSVQSTNTPPPTILSSVSPTASPVASAPSPQAPLISIASTPSGKTKLEQFRHEVHKVLRQIARSLLWQSALVVGVFVITLLLAWETNTVFGFWISDEQVANFMAAFSQVIASLLGLLIVYLLFLLQLTDEKRSNAYQEMRHDLEDLMGLMLERASNPTTFYSTTVDELKVVIDRLASLKVKEILYYRRELETLLTDKIQYWESQSSGLVDMGDKAYHQRIAMELGDIQHHLYSISLQHRVIETSSDMIYSIAKLMGLLGFSLALFIGFSIVSSNGNYLKWNLPAVSTMLMCLSIVLIEVLVRTRDIFVDIRSGY